MRRTTRSSAQRIAWGVALWIALCCSSAWAQETRSKPSLAIFMTPEVTTMRLLGASNELTSWSIGGHLRQGIVLGPWLTSLRIGGDAFLTYQEAPPTQRGLRTFMTNFSTGLRKELGPLRVGANAEYAILNLSGNPLDQAIGPLTRYHLVGGSAAISFAGLAPILAEVRVSGFHWLKTESPTQSLQITFSIGLEAPLRR